MTHPSEFETPAPPVLSVDGISLSFGGVHALHDISFAVQQGEICAVIGPNGAGKTSLFNVLTQLYVPDEGRAHFDGNDLFAAKKSSLVRLGISRTFQNLALFSGLTVLENVMLGAHSHHDGGFLSAMVRLPRERRSERRTKEEAHGLLERLGLQDLAHAHVDELSYGTLKRVEITRALAANPKLLLLDEPAAGLNHAESAALGETILKVREDFGLTVVIVDHHMGLVLAVADHVVALNFGTVIADGLPSAVAQDPEVVAAYLGRGAA